MPLPDHNTTVAAALYGHTVASLTHPGQKHEEGDSDATPVKNPKLVLSGNWTQADSAEREPFLRTARFLSSWSRSGTLEDLDRDSAAEALAGQLKGTALEGVGFNYLVAVEIYVNTVQALRS